MKPLIVAISFFAIIGCTTNKLASNKPVSTRTPAATSGKNYSAEILDPGGLGSGAIAALKYKNSIVKAFGFARGVPHPFFKHMREAKDPNIQTTGILKISGAESGRPDMFIITPYDYVTEALRRNVEFTVKPNREPMNNTVGPFMLAYEENEDFSANPDIDEKKHHPGAYKRTHHGVAHGDHSINFRGEKEYMWKLVNRPEDKARVQEISRQAAREAIAEAQKAGKKSVVDIVKYVTRAVPIAIVREYFGLKPFDERSGAQYVKLNNDLLAFYSRWTQNSFFHNPAIRGDGQEDWVKRMAIYAVRGFDAYKTQTGKSWRPKVPTTGKRVHKSFPARLVKELDKGMIYFAKRVIKRRKSFLANLESDNGGTKITFGNYHSIVPQNQQATIDLMILAEQIHADKEINKDRIVSNFMGLLVGAVETGNAASAQALEVILNDNNIRSMAQKAADNGDFDKFTKIVWEAHRFNPINPWVARIASRDVADFHGAKIDKGSIVMVATESAMMDPKAFEEPEKFNPDRYDNPIDPDDIYSGNPMFLHMGYSRHTCLGFSVAYEFVAASLFEAFKALPNLRKSRPGQTVSFTYPGRAKYENPFPENFQLNYGDGLNANLGRAGMHLQFKYKDSPLGAFDWFLNITDTTWKNSHFPGIKSSNPLRGAQLVNKIKNAKTARNFQSTDILPMVDELIAAKGITEGDLYEACMDHNKFSPQAKFDSTHSRSNYCRQPLKMRMCHLGKMAFNGLDSDSAYDSCVDTAMPLAVKYSDSVLKFGKNSYSAVFAGAKFN